MSILVILQERLLDLVWMALVRAGDVVVGRI